jgi:hypothetical protein
MTLLISLILILGGAQGPSGNFDESTAVSDSVATSQNTTSTTPVQQSKRVKS